MSGHWTSWNSRTVHKLQSVRRLTFSWWSVQWLLGCDSVKTGKISPTFRRYLLPPSSEYKTEVRAPPKRRKFYTWLDADTVQTTKQFCHRHFTRESEVPSACNAKPEMYSIFPTNTIEHFYFHCFPPPPNVSLFYYPNNIVYICDEYLAYRL